MPKWTNKGHEFDELGNYFKEHNQITICAESEEKVFILKKKLEFLNVKINIIPRLPAYNGGGYKGAGKLIYKISYKLKKIFYGHKMNKYKLEKSIILFSNASRDSFYFMCGKGYIENKDLFMAETFFAKYLSIFAVYVCDKVYFPTGCIVCTTICNLNCTDCLNFTPYIKKKEHYSFDELKKSIDVFFKHIDYIDLFHITGGEPLLYPNLAQLINYIYENYSSKIHTLGTTVNGSIVPSEEMLELFKKCNLKIYLDDYRTGVPRLETTFSEALDKFKQYKIDLEIFTRETFFPLFPPAKSMENLTEEELAEKFSCCANPFTQLKDGRLFNCNWSNFATTAGLMEFREEECFDLNNIGELTPDEKKYLVEYRLGYSPKGYVEFCKYCNGSYNINKAEVPAARQTKGLLEWDKSNPCTVRALNERN